MSFVKFDSEWFQCYCRAILESNPEIARIYAREALDAMSQAKSQPDMEDGEREAISVALGYLHLIEIG